jgi:hypothetical protein
MFTEDVRDNEGHWTGRHAWRKNNAAAAKRRQVFLAFLGYREMNWMLLISSSSSASNVLQGVEIIKRLCTENDVSFHRRGLQA